MSYETGTATSQSDLLDKLKVFVQINGWTINEHTSGSTLQISKAGGFFGFRALSAETPPNSGATEMVYGGNASGANQSPRTSLICVPATGYAGGTLWWKQSGAPSHSSSGVTYYHGVQLILPGGSIPAYHFFAHEDCVYVVIEYSAGYYRHLIFGTLEKIGSWTGGQFCSAAVDTAATQASANSYAPYFAGRSTPSAATGMRGWLRCAEDGFTSQNGWKPGGSQSNFNPALPFCFDDVGYLYQPLNECVINYFNPVVVALPIRLYMYRETSNSPTATPHSPVGHLPNIFYFNLYNHVPGQEYSIGSDTYRVFPFTRKENFHVGQYNGSQTSWGAIGVAIKSN